jgi:calcineurin-like phosphoesterase family protein
MFLKRVFILFACFVFLSATTLVCLGTPSYKVTVGSEFSIKAEDVGLTSFTGKTKVFVFAGRKRKNVKTRISADRTSLNCTWAHPLNTGRYSIYLETEEDKEKTTHKVTDFFAILSPSIHKVSSSSVAGGSSLTVSGSFFSTKCKIFMGITNDNMQLCRFQTNKSDVMDRNSGASSAEIIVPKNINSASGALIRVVSAAGSDNEIIDSDLADNDATAYILSVADIHETSKYLSKISNFITTFKQVHNNMTLALYGGDILSAYARTNYDPEWARDLYTDNVETHGETIMNSISQMAFDVVTIGNHDQCMGYKRFYELLETYSSTVISSNLFQYEKAQFTAWTSPGFSTSPDYVSFQVKGLNVSVVAVSSTHQDHWTDADKSSYRVVNAMNERCINNIRSCALFNDIVILITHQDDVSAIIPVYGTPTPRGEYIVSSDIYTLKDLQNVALIVGGHEHKNYFRRASYANDNDTYALYINKIYNPNSKLVLIKSSKFYGEYVGVVKILWNKSDKTVTSINMIEGTLGNDGKYLGCASEQIFAVDDDGLFQELDNSPWDPTVSTHWWRMDDWPNDDKNIQRIISKHK